MARELKSLQFEEFVAQAPSIFDQVEASGNEVVVERHGRLFSVKPKSPRKARTKRHFGPDDSLLDVIGIGHSGQHDVSAHKHDYLAGAVADLHDASEA